jgi:hypothetical protein
MTESTVPQEAKKEAKKEEEAVKSEKSKYQTHCPECKEALPRGSFFCPQCDPPGILDDDPNKGLSGFQAFLRIGVILSLFLAIAFYKLDLSIYTIMQEMAPEAPTTAPSETQFENTNTPAKDTDFAITNFINTNSANIRSKASTSAPVVIKANKGEVVKILQRGDKWSQIEVKGKKGWVSNALLSSEVREVP